MRSLKAFLALAVISVPVAITACAENADENTGASDDALSKKGEGAKCKLFDETSCKKGLLCAPEEGKNGGLPPGAMGMPSPYGKCRKPTWGERGGPCNLASPCGEGLACVFPDGGNGQVAPPHFPPGAMGMPVLQKGTCEDAPPPAVDAGSAQTCPPDGVINCMPVTDDPNCVPARRTWIEQNCSGISFLD